VQLGQYVLIFQESKGPLHAFAAEVIHVEETTVKIAVFNIHEEFRIMTATMEGQTLIGPRDTIMVLREPNAKEKTTIAKTRQKVLSRLTDAERRAYENPADDGKKRKKKDLVEKWSTVIDTEPKSIQIIESKPSPVKTTPKKATKKVATTKKTAVKRARKTKTR